MRLLKRSDSSGVFFDKSVATDVSIILIMQVQEWCGLPPSPPCDVCRKIPKDLTEATVSGAGLSIVAAVVMLILFFMVRPPSFTKGLLP